MKECEYLARLLDHRLRSRTAASYSARAELPVSVATSRQASWCALPGDALPDHRVGLLRRDH